MFRLSILTSILLAFALITVIGGCSGPVSSGDINDTSYEGFLNPIDIPDEDIAREAEFIFPEDHCGDYVIKRLYAGQSIHVGWVAVWNDADAMYVHYLTAFGWEMSETHLAVVDDLEDIPHTKKGNPKIGHFPYKGDHDPMLTNVRYEIDTEDWTIDSQLYIMAHAVVNLVDENGNIIQEETAWGDGCYPCDEMKSGSWAMFFTYELQECF